MQVLYTSWCSSHSTLHLIDLIILITKLPTFGAILAKIGNYTLLNNYSPAYYTGNVDFANISMNVSFEIGTSKACFDIKIYMDQEMEGIEIFRLKILDLTEEIVLDKDSDLIVIAIVDTESRECCVQQ